MLHPNRSAYVRAPWQFEVRPNPVPDPGPGEILVHVATCSVCGTDLHIADRYAPDWQTFGHEIAGMVRAVGPGVTRLAAGDRVALDSSAPCGACTMCQPAPYGRGRPDLCRGVSYWGSATMGFGELLLSPHQCAVKLPDGIPFETGSLGEPLCVATELVRCGGAGPGDHVLVIGPGPLGLAAVFLAKRAGAERVWLAGFSHAERRFAAGRLLGADSCIFVDETPLASFDFGGRKPDRILSTAPPATLPEAIGAAAPGGTVSYIGIAWDESAKIVVDADHLHFNKITLRPAHPTPSTHLAESVALLHAAPELARTLLTHRFTLDALPEAVRFAGDERNGVIKSVMVNSGLE